MLASYTLRSGVEDLVFTGAGAFKGKGNDAANHLTGGAGNDLLDGGAGIDVMTGLGGDDTYYVNSASDVVIEAINGGTDRVVSTAASYTLAAEVEILQLSGNAVTGIGNALGNTPTSISRVNTLDGGAGADVLTGRRRQRRSVFRAGEANGEWVTDFRGAGAAVGDRLQFAGFGDHASVTRVGSTDFYTVSGSLGSATIQLMGVYNLDTSASTNDYFFG
ncbi:calcium-binding protein [Sphingomonas sp. MMS24-JH45]